ncbi:hypothetical protein K502DRAFT_367483 [Neoconidiobolus thromboides FSU 785]|nr:hypothetical protein K502DRAFT_367483 [Neoconidiobolus thromboides FSU 785]
MGASGDEFVEKFSNAHDNNDSKVPRKGTGSSYGAYFNIVCVVAGTGTLGLPYAMSLGGHITLVLFVIAACLAVYTSKLLIECLYCKPGIRLEEYPDIGEAAFGKFGRYFVKIFHYIISLSSTCIYILLTGLNLHSFLVNYYGDELISLKLWILISGVIIIIPTACLKTLKEIAILAAFGAVATLVVVLCVVILGAMQYYDPNYVRPDLQVVNWSGLPIALATIAFSYGGNVVYPHVEATMRNPKAWNKVMGLAILSITCMYIVVAVSGYVFYGENVKSPVLDSLQKGPGALVASILITIHVILASPIYLCSFCLEQERWLKIDTEFMSPKKEFVYRVLLRSFFGIILTVIAMYVPYFNDLMALIGAVSNCLIIFLIPVICHFKLFGFKKRPFYDYILAPLCIIVGALGLVLGSIDAVSNLIKAFQGNK